MRVLARLTFSALVVLLVLFEEANAQYVFNKKTHIPVLKGDTLKFPWTGGFNNPQFSGADLNNDGIKDLVSFDRTGDRTITFLNAGIPGEINYSHAPQFEYAFNGYSQWMLMEDFNCDGIPDVFTYDIDLGGAGIYRMGRYTNDNRIEFDSITFFAYPSFSPPHAPINIFISAPDIPAFCDMNNDGDIDILTFEQLGSTIRYFENQSQELTGTCGDTVFFEEYPTCWGDIYEPPGACYMVLDSCGAFKTSENRSDGAHTLLAFDEDADGDKELLISQLYCDRFYRMLNGGTEGNAHVISQDLNFPSYDKPYKNNIFPGSFYVDLNNDGKRDLLAAPNFRGSENYECVWMYQNTGKDDSAVFQFVTDTFLIDNTLDFGEGAYPAFFDYNADGLLDLVVGNYGYYINGTIYRTGLALMENIGTPTFPAFRLVDTDYASVSSLSRKAIAPAFGDMDDDGDSDMIVGEFDGYLHYYQNNGGAGNPAQFSLQYVNMFGIDVGQFSTPFIYDVNGDSLPDLIVGEKSGNGNSTNRGEINYFENIGTSTSFVFDTLPTNDIFGEVDVRITGFPNGYCTPVITTLDSSGKPYLVSGSEEGTLKLYEFNSDSIYSGSFRRRSRAYSDIDEGERTAIAIADLTGDGKMEMVVGNYRGGLAFFSQSDTLFTEIEDEPQKNDFSINLYPNPAHDFIFISLVGYQSSESLQAQLFDLMGKKIFKWKLQPQPVQQLSLPVLATGMYFFKLSHGSRNTPHKIFIRQ